MEPVRILGAVLTALGMYDLAAFFLFDIRGYLLYAALPTAVALAAAYLAYRSAPATAVRRRYFFETKVIGGDTATATDRTAIDKLRARVEELGRAGAGGEELLALKLALAKALLDGGRRDEAKRLVEEVGQAIDSARPRRHIVVMYRALRGELERGPAWGGSF
ncbi:MAG: hypothetical protein JHC22_03970 [Thermoproteus sp.]|jgi:hypothetical protein|nr:hypothetical protein [Thermoproteus sp.]